MYTHCFVLCLVSWEEAISAGPGVCMWMASPGSGAEEVTKKSSLFPLLSEGKEDRVFWMPFNCVVWAFSSIWVVSSGQRIVLSFPQYFILYIVYYLKIRHLSDKVLFPGSILLPRLIGGKINHLYVGLLPKLPVLILYFYFFPWADKPVLHIYVGFLSRFWKDPREKLWSYWTCTDFMCITYVYIWFTAY